MSTIPIPADLSEPNTITDPKSEGRGLVVGLALALAFWSPVAVGVWAVFG